jgi:hypothetical protein
MKDTSVIIGMAAIAVVIGVVIFLNGGGDSNAQLGTSGANTPPAVAVPFTKIVSGTQSKVTERVNYLITSPSELTKLWGMISTTGTPPKIDFNKEAVLAVFAGSEPVTAIAVAKIADATERIVSITISRPDGTCATKLPATSAYELVSVPVTPLPLTHTDQVTAASCPK